MTDTSEVTPFEEWVDYWVVQAEPRFRQRLQGDGLPNAEDIAQAVRRPQGATLGAYLTRLFNDPSYLTSRYSMDQLAVGLSHLLGHLHVMVDDSVPLPVRLDLVRSISVLYEGFFARVCGDALCHVNEAARPINGVCYMFWELGGLFSRDHPSTIRDAQLDVLEKALASQSVAVQESALHGLGHAHHAHPEPVERIVQGFLDRNTGLRPELRSYAEAAKHGCVM